MVIKVTTYEALEPFLTKPREALHIAEISRSIGQPHPTVRQWLNQHENAGVLKRENKGRLTLYRINLAHPNILDYLAIAEKARLVRACERYPLLAELAGFISRNCGTALIFGSASVSFKDAHDIDLVIIGQYDAGKLKELSERLNRELHIINVNSLKNISQNLRKEILKKHLLINDSEGLLRWLIWQE